MVHDQQREARLKLAVGKSKPGRLLEDALKVLRGPR